MELIHTCYRIGEIDRSVAFYEALGSNTPWRCRLLTSLHVYEQNVDAWTASALQPGRGTGLASGIVQGNVGWGGRVQRQRHPGNLEVGAVQQQEPGAKQLTPRTLPVSQHSRSTKNQTAFVRRRRISQQTRRGARHDHRARSSGSGARTATSPTTQRSRPTIPMGRPQNSSEIRCTAR